jgi:hypothetical protein
MNTILEGWTAYERDVLPANAGAVQRHECRAAFYGGASWLLNLTAALSDMTDDAALEVLKGLHLEASDFANRGIFDSHARLHPQDPTQR